MMLAAASELSQVRASFVPPPRPIKLSRAIPRNLNQVRAAAGASSRASAGYAPLVKMCGITTPEDANAAAEAGANLVGMILWPHSKRSVSLELAKEITAAAREQGAEPVGVFVDEDAETIEKACDKLNLSHAQLHGVGARASLANLSSELKIIYVAQVDEGGVVRTEEPSAAVEWILVDSIQGGSGKSFDWSKFRAPACDGSRGWLLAGGLNPENVAAAVALLRPSGVDVSSGITGPNGVSKDIKRILSFMESVKNWEGTH